MNKLISFMRKAPKRTSAVLAMIAAAVVVPAALWAWGPTDRDTFTMEHPATYVTFNSITDNPDYGDERNFVRIKDASDTSAGNWKDEIKVQAGKEYLVQLYVHNNAADNLNLVAENVRTKVNVPTTTGKKVQLDGFISASNAKPGEIWDQATFTGDNNFNIAYVPGSAVYYNNKTGQAGTKLSDSIVTNTGVQLGYELPLDGKMLGCFKYSGYVSFKVKAQVQQTTNFTLQKKVSKHGESKWGEDYKAQPGEVVDFLLAYKNTGEVQHDDVTIRDTLPTGLSYVANSATWSNASKQNVKPVNDAALTNGTGINVGSYAPGANAYVTFSAKVADNTNLPACGTNTLTNKGKVNTGGYAVEDNATVTVDKECKPVAKYTCDSLTVTKLERTKFKFETKYTVQNATFKNVTYVVRNASGTEVYRGTNSSYTQTTVGKYTVQAIVTVTVDGSDKTVTSDSCKKAFEVVKEKTPAVSIDKKVDGVEKNQVAVNQEFTYQLVVTNTGEVDLKNVAVSDPAPTNVQFISADKGTIANNKWSYTIAELKVGQSASFAIKAKVTKEVTGAIVNTACVDAPQVPGSPDDCDDATVEVPPTPTKIEVCDLTSKTVITIDETAFDSSKHSKNLSDCAEVPVTPVTPETPSELPTTGAADQLFSALGLGALIASATYYVASRRLLA